MAHQWFGDLVTMQWWDNIWLNEGFATWMETKPVKAMHPEWDIDQEEVSGLEGALNLDAQPTTRAIRATANTREEIEQMFDGISYQKAGSVLFMIENYLGEEPSAKACTTIWPRMHMATPRQKISGARRRRPAASPSTKSWRAT